MALSPEDALLEAHAGPKAYPYTPVRLGGIPMALVMVRSVHVSS